MIAPGARVRVYLACGRTDDMRKGLDGLAMLVQQVFGENPFDGAVYAFRGRRAGADALEPGAEVVDYPVMLDLPAPRLRAYARETVIAEKFQAMVTLGRANSRMKDFYDIWILSRSFSFDDDRLVQAIAATFAGRETAIPIDLPDALTSAFAADEQKQR